MRDDRSAIRKTRSLGAAGLIALVALSCRSGAPNSSLPPNWSELRFDHGTTVQASALFRWDNASFAAFDARTGRITLLRPDGQRVEVRPGPSLPADDHPVHGALLQDLFDRSLGGRIFWLDRDYSRIRVFDHEGEPLSDWRVPCQPWSFSTLSDDEVVVHGTKCSTAAAGAYRFDWRGSPLAFEPSWMQPDSKTSELAAAFVVTTAGRRADFMLFLPFVRVVEGPNVRILRADDCSAVPSSVSQRFRDDDTRLGLPQPFGSGVTGKRDATPFFLHASGLSGGGISAVGNGNVVFSLQPDGRMDCWRFPVPEGQVVNGIEVIPQHVALLTTGRDDGDVRIWRNQ